MLTAELFLTQQAYCKGTICMKCQALFFMKNREMSDLIFSGKYVQMLTAGLFSSPGLCRAYVVTQSLASASVGICVCVRISTMFKFSKVCTVFLICLRYCFHIWLTPTLG